jgi:hypothetical protein
VASCDHAAPMKNDGKSVTSPTTNTRSAKTTDLVASIGTRLGTSTRLARIIPVKYWLVMTMTPSTQIVGRGRDVYRSLFARRRAQ